LVPNGGGESVSDESSNQLDFVVEGVGRDRLGVGEGISDVSGSFGVGRRSKELEEADVKADVEEEDLWVIKIEESVLVLDEDGGCSGCVEAASLFDIRRDAEVDEPSSGFWWSA